MTLEELRTLSKLSEQVHFLESSGKSYAVYSGIALPSNVFHSILIWVLSNTTVHRHLLTPYIDEIMVLNPGINSTLRYSSSSLSYDLILKFQKLTENWTQNDYYRLIQNNQ